MTNDNNSNDSKISNEKLLASVSPSKIKEASDALKSELNHAESNRESVKKYIYKLKEQMNAGKVDMRIIEHIRTLRTVYHYIFELEKIIKTIISICDKTFSNAFLTKDIYVYCEDIPEPTKSEPTDSDKSEPTDSEDKS